MNKFNYIVMNNGNITAMSVAAVSKLDAFKRIKQQYPNARIFRSK